MRGWKTLCVLKRYFSPRSLVLTGIFGLSLILGLWGQAIDTIAIENVHVIPMTEERVIPHQRVLIANGKLLRIEPASTPLLHRVHQTIDGTGKYLIPGLSEMHYHSRGTTAENDFKLFIANGITTVRNMAEGDRLDQIAIRRKTREGALPIPNYFTTGPYLTRKQLQSKEQVIQQVKKHKRRGYDFMKLADNLPEERYLDLLAACRENGLPLLGHAQRQLPAEFSLRMKSVEHLEEFLYGYETHPDSTYFKSPPAELKRLASLVKTSGVYVGTTLSVFEFILQCLSDDSFKMLREHEWVRYLAQEERENFLTEKNDYRKLRNIEIDGMASHLLFQAYFSWMKSFARLLSETGVPLLTGSDTYGMVIMGFSLHREFALLQEAGLKPYEILLASTVNPARYLNTYATEGTLVRGKNANLVMLARNPLEDIRNTTQIEGVMVKGRWFNRAQLQVMLQEVEAAYSEKDPP